MNPVRKTLLVLGDARRALQMTQAELARAIGGAQRTVARWEAGGATPAAHHYARLATLLYPVRRDLAEEVAVHAGESLVSLGIEAPPAPPPPPPAVVVAPIEVAPPSVAKLQPKPEVLVDVLVLALMLESDAPYADARRGLHAALKRGCDVGLTMQEAEEALRRVTTGDAVG
jgi:transcriptional regulator with XRE-family HTH domain